MVQDLYDGDLATDVLRSENKWVINVEVYIGDEVEYADNTKCAGGPFMRPTDPSNFRAGQDNTRHQEDSLWNFGFETWCNLQG